MLLVSSQRDNPLRVLLHPPRVEFGFTDRPTLTVYLSVIARRTGETWLINHYQVSRLGDSNGNHSVPS